MALQGDALTVSCVPPPPSALTSSTVCWFRFSEINAGVKRYKFLVRSQNLAVSVFAALQRPPDVLVTSWHSPYMPVGATTTSSPKTALVVPAKKAKLGSSGEVIGAGSRPCEPRPPSGMLSVTWKGDVFFALSSSKPVRV